MSEPKELTYDDLMGMPSHEIKTAETIINVQGQEFKIKIYADARENPERLYQLAGCHERARMDCGMIPGMPKPETIGLKFHLPPTPGRKPELVHITDLTYLAQLYILEVVAFEPKFNAIQWATLGRKVTKATDFEAFMSWVSVETGYVDYIMEKQAQLKKAMSGVLGSPVESSGHASTSSTEPPKKSSQKSRSTTS